MPKRDNLIKRGWQELLIEIAEGQGKGCFVSLLRGGLTVLSGVYKLLIEVRLFFYRSRLLRRKKLSAYVISVGNITVGGTGKTPLVEMLAGELQGRGCQVAILSRGYKRVGRRPSAVGCPCPNTLAPLPPSALAGTGEHRPWAVGRKIGVVSDGTKLLMDVREAGDEPYLLAGNLPGAAVLVGKDRIRLGNYALANLGVDTLVLDDGYQYWPLERDLEVVVIDSTNPFGNGHLLPRGRLREPLKNLKRAGLFLLTRVDQADDLDGLRERLRKLKPGAGMVETVHRPHYLIDLKTGEKQELGILSGKKVLALSSIGHPQSFEKTLTELGALLVEKVRFPDHHWYRETELREVGKKAIRKEAELIVTTQKDAVRVPPGRKLSLKLLYLVIKLRIVKGKEVLEELLPEC